MPNPGSLGHPEVCKRPCVYWTAARQDTRGWAPEFRTTPLFRFEPFMSWLACDLPARSSRATSASPNKVKPESNARRPRGRACVFSERCCASALDSFVFAFVNQSLCFHPRATLLRFLAAAMGKSAVTVTCPTRSGRPTWTSGRGEAAEAALRVLS